MTTAAPSRTRIRVAASCFLLVGLAMVQAPGLTVSDTKFDLAVAPAGFLRRALYLWDPTAALGQLQNQAYGYLWPMGPFFLLGHEVGLAPWVVQRLWVGLVMCTAFVGAVCLVRALGVRSDLAALVAGFAYATSPRMLTTLGPISIEAWPSALAPWVLLPLVIGASRGSPRRAAALSALAVSMVGGVNAAATFAVVPMALIWLATRAGGPRRRALTGWWVVFTAIGTAWWLVPLFLLGAYSPPFLDFIENADVTTFPTTVVDALRGTSDWVPYVDVGWVGGRAVITTAYIAADTGLLLALGLWGIGRNRRHGRFLLLSLLAGLVLVTLGHQGSVQGWFASAANGVLDGALAPARNVHKFDPIIRLPLVVGLAMLVDPVVRGLRHRLVVAFDRTWRVPVRVVVAGVVCLALAGAASPVLAGRLAPADAVAATPDYWSQAISWIDERGGAALLAPGTSFGSYTWGTPNDEPAQYLGAAHWAVRNAVPLAPAGNIRMLDAVEERLAQGHASVGLAAYLARAGIRYVVVRNDLAASDDVPDPALVTQALAGSAGIRAVRSFGPDVGGDAEVDAKQRRLVVDDGRQARRQAIDVYEVRGAATSAAVATASAPVVVGAPEDLLELADVDRLPAGPTVLAADLGAGGTPGGPVILTDGDQRRERSFGRVHDAASAVVTPGDVRREGNRVEDYELPGGTRWQTTARLVGARSISASTSLSDADTVGGARPGDLPYAAVDGDPTTSWISRPSTGPAWWQLALAGPRAVSTVTLTRGTSVGPGRVTLSVSAGDSHRSVTLSPGETGSVRLDAASASSLRIEGPEGVQLDLAGVAFPGLRVRRELVTPAVPRSWGAPQTILLHAARDARTGCVVVGERTPCRAGTEGSSEEPARLDRLVTIPSGRSYSADLTAAPVAGKALDALIAHRALVGASASSTAVPDARDSALAAIDGDPGTAWAASIDDAAPEFEVHWVGERAVRGLTARVSAGTPVRRPTAAVVSWPGGQEAVRFDSTGRAVLEHPIRTDRLTLRVTGAELAAATDRFGTWQTLPVGISSLTVAGAPTTVVPSTTTRTWRCGTGPTIDVDGRRVRTRLVASPADLYRMQLVRAVPCRAGVTLASGANRIQVTASAVAAPATLVLDAGAAARAAAGEDEPVTVPRVRTAADGQSLSLTDTAGGRLVALRQNVNPGWVATQDGKTLRPVTIDGWQQGWVTSGGDPIRASYRPDAMYRTGLVAGLVVLVLFWVVTIAVPRRRWPSAGLPPTGIGGGPVWVLVATAALAVGVVAGWAGVVAALAGAVVALLTRRLGTHGGSAAAGMLLFAAAAGYVLRPWGGASEWAGEWRLPQLLAVAALGCSIAVVAASERRRRRRAAGRSTRR